ncbi:MAG: hypothetical protein O3A00_04765 [Planctomycetota bacterium]|nr:hypothetical protein [Planctomycetota bacterium]
MDDTRTHQPHQSRLRRLLRHRVEAGVIAVVVLSLAWLLFKFTASPPDRVAVSGTVIGAEDRDGLIMFISQDEHATVAVTELKRGKYQFTSTEGPVPGTQRILIRFEVGPLPIPADSVDPVFNSLDAGSTIPAYGPAILLKTRIPDAGSDRLDLELP